ncbi:penicillin-binding protein 2 [Fimbriimonas ginsengisoli]|uniref:penicillin-binding protein 2 n=1 Tax=Fimbriimonas ginsengisoli TaxID=1005039 RepID=UPI00057008F7|nr:penicillin-binding protein 2 [Fimbriimonas ginsengisoli]
MSVIHTPRKPELDLRILAFPAVMVGALSVLFLRLWYFQVVEAPTLVEKAEASRVVPVMKPAPRGLIFDRNGVPIAIVRPEIVVTAIPNKIKANPWVLDRVAKILGVEVEKLERKVRDATWRPFLPTPIYVGADIKAGTRIAEEGEELPGIGVETQPMRHYPDSTSFTHVLGYVWVPSDKDVARIEKSGKPVPDFVGKGGIERAYDDELMGLPGAERMAIDARRQPIRVEGRDAATPGNQLVLTLDGDLQRYVTQLFKESHFMGGAVALDPRTGEVLCLVSSPTFDQSLFSGGISDEEWKVLNDNPEKPQIDRAIFGAYAPGSTFKIVTTVAAARTGKFNVNDTYYCPGGYFKRGVHLRCLGQHGAISFENAMAKSCNTYFCNLGVAVGPEAIRSAALDMGLGQRSGIEIGGPMEVGTVPTLDWLRKVSKKKNPPWYLGDTANLSIGQGYLATTPLQMAEVAAMVANDGVSYKPHLVRAIKDPTGQQAIRQIAPEVAHKVDLPASFWAELRKALVGVVDHGTAQRARINGVSWGGKTGSAEHLHGGKKTHGWFVGFAPAEAPKIVICVLWEEGGHGGDSVAPIAKEIVQRYLMPPKKAVSAATSSSAAALSPAARSKP